MLPLRTAPTFSLRLLLHERARLVSSIGGVTFALLLMLLQIGFRNALLDSSLQMLRQLDADVIVIHKEKEPFMSRMEMPKERLYQSLSVEGVASAKPIWLTLLHWKNPLDETLHPIRVIGIAPGDAPLLIPEVRAAEDRLRQPGTALIDSRSRASYGYLGQGEGQVAQRIVRVEGTFPLGSDFEVDGNLIVSESTFFELSGMDRRQIEIAVLKLEPGADEDKVIAGLRSVLPTDVRVYSKPELIESDLDYWKSGTPISVILMVGVALGFAVGVVICYQILYTDVLDHLAEFATLKAIGYGDVYIRAVVMIESIVLSVLGCAPACAVGWLMLALLREMSGLPARLAGDDVLVVALLSVAMCVASGVFALRKVRMLDPAELF